jgi:hypothetical protein
MNYFKQNLDNSLILPYDIMLSIYEYADCLGGIRRQIDNKEYDLDDIMYKKMKKWIINNYFSKQRPYLLSYIDDNDNYYHELIQGDNIDDIDLKDAMLNYTGGYKNFFLWKGKRLQTICGLEIFYYNPIKRKIYFEQLKKKMERVVITNIGDEDIYDNTNIYELWCKL